MLSILGKSARLCDGITRREILRVGGLAFAGLSLADILKLRAGADAGSGRGKSVILIWLRGGASHIDSYDMKPAAPMEIRGEFSPIRTNVPGIQICEHMPRQARIMDKLAILRGIKSNDLGDHTPHYIITGSGDRGRRPAFGSIVSYLKPRSDGLPAYTSLMYKPPGLYDNESPLYCGPAHRPFAPKGEGLENMTLVRGISLSRLQERRHMIDAFDGMRRDVDVVAASIDPYRRQALEMITSPRARQAFDLSQEPAHVHERYGKFCESFLMARRLVEAGVSVVTLKVGDWDTHEHNFREMRAQLPPLDQGFHALVTDLHDRGLDKDVAVVMWGEFGRSPRIDRNREQGRDHWPEAGAAVVAGGGFRVGQAIGETDAHAARSRGNPYTPGNVLACMYQHLGINPAMTIPDHLRRPIPLLDDATPVRELMG